MDDTGLVGCMHRIGDLADDLSYLIKWPGSLLPSVFLEEFAVGPFDSKEVETSWRLPDFNCADHIGVNNPSSIARFPQKARNCCRVMAQFVP
ncbi:MAG: hypothetical protein NVSMB22_00050 [Chloroflexota bacterium]